MATLENDLASLSEDESVHAVTTRFDELLTLARTTSSGSTYKAVCDLVLQHGTVEQASAVLKLRRVRTSPYRYIEASTPRWRGDVVRDLLQTSPDLGEARDTLFSTALVNHHDYTTAEAIARSQIDVNKTCWWLIETYPHMYDGHVHLLREILKHPGIDKGKALLQAVLHDSVQAAKVVLETDIDAEAVSAVFLKGMALHTERSRKVKHAMDVIAADSRAPVREVLQWKSERKDWWKIERTVGDYIVNAILPKGRFAELITAAQDLGARICEDILEVVMDPKHGTTDMVLAVLNLPSLRRQKVRNITRDVCAWRTDIGRHFSCDYRPDVVRALLADPGFRPALADQHLLVQKAVNAKDADMVRVLLHDPRIEPSARILMQLDYGSTVDVVAELLKHPMVDPSANYSEALVHAVKISREDLVMLYLTNPRVDPFRVFALAPAQFGFGGNRYPSVDNMTAIIARVREKQGYRVCLHRIRASPVPAHVKSDWEQILNWGELRAAWTGAVLRAPAFVVDDDGGDGFPKRARASH